MWAIAGQLVRWGTALFAADTVSRGVTGEGLVEHGADAVSDHLVQPVLEGIAESGVDAEQHASGQNLISWSNFVASIPLLGQSSIGLWLTDFLRDWGEGYQNANTENDGTTAPDTTEANNSDMGGIAMSAFNGAAIGATVGSFVPVIGTALGAAIGGAAGGGLGLLESKTGWVSGMFNFAAEGLGLRDDPNAAPAAAPVPVMP